MCSYVRYAQTLFENGKTNVLFLNFVHSEERGVGMVTLVLETGMWL